MVARRARLAISAGRFGGRVIETPKGIRPTASLTREALMSIWQSRLEGAAFLDLFAGSGAVGIEAISRGAVRGVFVDHDPQVLSVVEANLRALSVQGAAVVRSQLPAGLDTVARRTGQRFDLIFADPPYGFADLGALLSGLSAVLGPRTLAAIEHESERDIETDPDTALALYDHRVYGDSALSFYRLSSA